MKPHETLLAVLETAVQLYPDRIAIIEPSGGVITYKQLMTLANRLSARLHALGVRPRDRVGLYIRKSIDAVASIFGILQTGAAYVPVDPSAPTTRNVYILSNCAVEAIVSEKRFETALCTAWATVAEDSMPRLFLLDEVGGGHALRQALDDADEQHPAPAHETVIPELDDLAYILYTSGSTGRPKGVMLSHRNAVSFVNWCSETFVPQPGDRFSSHAPLHFDLSILDLYVPIKHGCTLVLIAEEVGKDPLRLAPLIAEQRISVWYSAPSILSILAQYGKLEHYDYSALRLILFAGEVFPVKHLRVLQALLPGVRYFNLYGPTETNVCTFFEIPTPIPEERTVPFPIGKACAHLKTMVVDEYGQEVRPGEEGELCVSGPSVMQGYWALAEQSAGAFLSDTNGQYWYRTGDLVYEEDDGNYTFVGRRDRMVKRRSYRIELGEIEAVLYSHLSVKEAAVIALPSEEAGVRIKAFLCCREGKRPSLIELKRFCTEHLPLYMIPDLFSFQAVLPKTSTDKIDYQRLKEIE
ncbi:MAG: amino acid adenylation domain-containing protein [Candidatus Tectimicrobiota bacterium]